MKWCKKTNRMKYNWWERLVANVRVYLSGHFEFGLVRKEDTFGHNYKGNYKHFGHKEMVKEYLSKGSWHRKWRVA
ncbi:MAG: hypothetical protein PVG39_00095 [Desulfobacteraceae bacterium]